VVEETEPALRLAGEVVQRTSRLPIRSGWKTVVLREIVGPVLNILDTFPSIISFRYRIASDRCSNWVAD
jgi:hypothetical protein